MNSTTISVLYSSIIPTMSIYFLIIAIITSMYVLYKIIESIIYKIKRYKKYFVGQKVSTFKAGDYDYKEVTLTIKKIRWDRAFCSDHHNYNLDDLNPLETKTKKRRSNMPRIFRYIYWYLLISLMWKLVNNIEVIIKFIIERYL